MAGRKWNEKNLFTMPMNKENVKRSLSNCYYIKTINMNINGTKLPIHNTNKTLYRLYNKYNEKKRIDNFVYLPTDYITHLFYKVYDIEYDGEFGPYNYKFSTFNAMIDNWPIPPNKLYFCFDEDIINITNEKTTIQYIPMKYYEIIFSDSINHFNKYKELDNFRIKVNDIQFNSNIKEISVNEYENIINIMYNHITKKKKRKIDFL